MSTATSNVEVMQNRIKELKDSADYNGRMYREQKEKYDKLVAEIGGLYHVLMGYFPDETVGMTVEEMMQDFKKVVDVAKKK